MMTEKKLDATHGVVCRKPGEKFGCFAWPTVARMDDGSLFSVCYQQAAPDEKCSILWSKWRLPA